MIAMQQDFPQDDAIACLRFQATSDQVSAQLAQLDTAFEQHNFPKALSEDVAIVLGEVLNNIVEHALAAKAGGIILLHVTRAEDRIHFSTTDRGRPLPPTLLQTPALPDYADDADLPEGGFGWFIIHSLVEDMVYERLNGTNHLSFSLPLAPTGPEAMCRRN